MPFGADSILFQYGTPGRGVSTHIVRKQRGFALAVCQLVPGVSSPVDPIVDADSY
jgi:hypothetical protein